MTRIISGAAGGRRLQTPAGPRTRPTSDRVREALFSRLEHLDVLAGARVLDLYAGSGALGLEAMSRGAGSAVLVDADRGRRRRPAATPLSWDFRASSCARTPSSASSWPGREPVAPWTWSSSTRRTTCPRTPSATRWRCWSDHGWLAPEALVVVERSARSPEPRWSEGLEPAGERRYGETRMWFADAPGPDDVA